MSSTESKQATPSGTNDASTTSTATALTGDELQAAVKQQLKFYFSKANLAKDQFLVSQMNSQMYVPVEAVAKFAKIAALTDDAAAVLSAMKASDAVEMSADAQFVKPNIKAQRNTIILREISGSTPVAEVEGIFTSLGQTPVNVRSDVGDTWFITMESEDVAMATILELRNTKFQDKWIKARLKSENVLLSIVGAAVGGPARKPPSADASVPPFAGGFGYPGAFQRRPYYPPGAYGGGAFGARGGMPATGAASGGKRNRKNKDSNGSGGNASPARRGDGGDKADKKKAAAAAAAAPAAKGRKGAQVNLMSSSQFPPLGQKNATTTVGYQRAFHKYLPKDMMTIFRAIPRSQVVRPEALDPVLHNLVANATPHLELVRRGRTASMDQALRHGRPVRTMSVDSMDMESFMFGEDGREKVAAAAAANKAAKKKAKNGSVGSAASGSSGKAGKGAGRKGSKKKGGAKADAPADAAAAPAADAPKGAYAAAVLSSARRQAAPAKAAPAKSAQPAPRRGRKGKDSSSKAAASTTDTAAAPAAAAAAPPTPPRPRRGWEKAGKEAPKPVVSAAEKKELKRRGEADAKERKRLEDARKAGEAAAAALRKKQQTATAASPASAASASAPAAAPAAAAAAAAPAPAAAGGWGSKTRFADLLKNSDGQTVKTSAKVLRQRQAAAAAAAPPTDDSRSTSPSSTARRPRRRRDDDRSDRRGDRSDRDRNHGRRERDNRDRDNTDDDSRFARLR